MAKTAAELMAELLKDKDFQLKKQEKEEKLAQLEKELEKDEKSIVEDLKKVGVTVGSVWDLVNTDKSYTNAIPVLLNHLEFQHHPRTLAGIARALAIPETNNVEASWTKLLELYLEETPDEEIVKPELRGFKEGLAVALSFLVNENRLDEYMNILKDIRHGESRIILVEGLSSFLNHSKVDNFLKGIKKDKLFGSIAKEILKGK